jgi:hypothetical protein
MRASPLCLQVATPSVNMETSKVITLLVTNKREVLSVEDKATLIRETEYDWWEKKTSWRMSGI